MSPREKNLLYGFAFAGFVIINVVGFQYYNKKKLEVHRDRLQAEQALDEARLFSAKRDEVMEDMEWLAKNEPPPAAYQDVQSKLQQLVEQQAQMAGLTIKPNSQKLLPTDETPGRHYHRAKVQITVTGMEQSLYQWFDRLNIPDQLRAVTNVRLQPDREDDTKIDCTAIIEQWFVPPPST